MGMCGSGWTRALNSLMSRSINLSSLSFGTLSFECPFHKSPFISLL